MKNNVIFSKGLFKEGLRQMRTLGLIYTCIGILSAFFTAHSYFESTSDYSYYSIDEVAPLDGSMMFLGYIGIFIVVPVMFLSMFGYLNSRSASDFYHSIPQSRVSVAVSFTAAIAVWFLAGFIPDMIIEMAVGAICGLEILFSEILTFLLVMIVLFIQLTGIMLISVSLATRTMNQAVLSMIIAFLPRVMIFILNVITENGAPVLFGLSDTLGRFGDIDINMLFGGIFSSSSIVKTGDFSPIIYSLILGIIYCVLGVVCYVRRKSETATVAGANKFVQCAIRVMVAFAFCLLPCLAFGVALISSADDPYFAEELMEMIPVILVMYGLSLIAYFAYEAISMKKIKGVLTLKGTMGIGLVILLALNLAFIITPALGAKVALSAEINTKTVESVVFTDLNSIYIEDDFSVNYIEEITFNYKFTDDEIIDIVSYNLSDNIRTIKNGGTLYGYSSKWKVVSVKFYMNDGRVLKRNVFIDKDDYKDLYLIMIADPGFLKSVREMPASDDVYYISVDTHDFDGGQRMQIYESLRNELTAMSDAEYIEYLNYNSIYDSEVTLYIDAEINGKILSNHYRITSKTPKTQRLMLDFVTHNDKYTNYQ